MGKLLMRGLPFSGKEPGRNTRHREPPFGAVRGGVFLVGIAHREKTSAFGGIRAYPFGQALNDLHISPGTSPE